MNEKPKTEPSADIRQATSAMWQVYVSLRDEGFTEKQALEIIGHILAMSAGGDR